jgi:hypothetical protein
MLTTIEFQTDLGCTLRDEIFARWHGVRNMPSRQVCARALSRSQEWRSCVAGLCCFGGNTFSFLVISFWFDPARARQINQKNPRPASFGHTCGHVLGHCITRSPWLLGVVDDWVREKGVRRAGERGSIRSGELDEAVLQEKCIC